MRHRCAASARSLIRMSTLEFSKLSPRYCSATVCPATHGQISFLLFSPRSHYSQLPRTKKFSLTIERFDMIQFSRISRFIGRYKFFEILQRAATQRVNYYDTIFRTRVSRITSTNYPFTTSAFVTIGKKKLRYKFF